MNRDDIIRLMEESGLAKGAGMIRVSKFANMVAAFEREECAKLLDEMAAEDRLSNYYQVAALRIRERGAP